VLVAAELSIGIPSTTNNGWFWPRIEPPPRATTRAEPNGLLVFVT